MASSLLKSPLCYPMTMAQGMMIAAVRQYIVNLCLAVMVMTHSGAGPIYQIT